MNKQQILDKLMQTGALLEGHFLLRSGLHSNRYFQAALALQYTAVAETLCGELAARFAGADVDAVISPAVGGIIAGHEVGRALQTRSVFAEKEENGELVLRRGFRLLENEKVLVAEDVITRGGRVQQTIDLVHRHGARVIGVAVLVDRSGGQVNFDVPVESLINLDLDVYEPENCPMCAEGLDLDKPGS